MVAWGVLAFSVALVLPAGWRRTLAVFVVLGDDRAGVRVEAFLTGVYDAARRRGT